MAKARESAAAEIVSRRVNDKLIAAMAIVIGAMASIMWGIVWNRVVDHDGRILTLEKEGSSVITTLRKIEADITDIKLDLRAGRAVK